MKTISTLAALATLALVAGTASAGLIEGGDRSGLIVPIDVEITHNFGSSSFIKSLMLTVDDLTTGEPNPTVFLLNDPFPVVTISTVGGALRAVEATEILDLPGGGKGVRWTFANSNLWSEGERLVFSFTADFTTGNSDRQIGRDFTFVPTPGSAAMLAGVGVLGMARRRR